MKISWNWMSELVDLTPFGTPERLAEVLTARGLEVEELTREGQGLEKVVTGRILEKGQHPGSDRLSYCQVDAGAGTPLNIVCGATNHKTGDCVVVAMIGANLPNGLAIGKSKIRGVESEGMLCSDSELGLAKESEGIRILAPGTSVGQPIAKFLGKDDTVLTLKLYANQGNLLSHVGVAREVAAYRALSEKNSDPSRYFSKAKLPHVAPAELFAKKGPITPKLEAGPLAPQFLTATVSGVKIGPSPEWLVKRLESLGSRSINNVVDATNLVLFELGHPVHAYDRAKLHGDAIRVRLATAGEKLPLLDDSEITLVGGELVISDKAAGADRAIGLAGVMGGANTEVSDATTTVTLECAQFDPIAVRRAKTKFSKHTEAAARFEKGIDAGGAEFVLGRLTKLVLELAGGKLEGGVAVRTNAPVEPTAISLRADFIPGFLGMEVSREELVRTFASLECKVKESKGADAGDAFHVIPPSYRLDLRIREDLAEEVARSIGYDRIPSTIPPLTTIPKARENGDWVLLNRAKDAFVRGGFSEALNYSFANSATLAGFGLAGSLKLLNPLSEEFEVMVPSLIPGLLANVQGAFRHHFGSESVNLKLFEIRPTFESPAAPGEPVRAVSQTDTGVAENWKCAFVMTGERFGEALRKEAGELDFYDLKAAALGLFEILGTKGVRFIKLSESRTKRAGNTAAVAGLYHPGVAAEVLLGNESLGIIGKLHPSVQKRLKLKQDVYLGEWDWKALQKMSRAPFAPKTYSAWSETPPIERDFAFVVDASVTADRIVAAALKAGKPLAKFARVFDVYRGDPVPAGKASVAIRVILQDQERSLQDAEVEPVSKAIIAALQKECGAELR